jgi:hypothetical protein
VFKAIWKDSKHLSKVAGRKPELGVARYTAHKSKIKVKWVKKANRLKPDGVRDYFVRRKQRDLGR